MSLHVLFDKLLEQHASDLHLTVGEPPALRVHGDIVVLDFPPITPENMNDMLRSIMNCEQWDEFVEELEIDFATAYADKARFRVNAYHQNQGRAAAFRIIPSQIPTIEQLGLPPVIKQVCERDRGFVLVTGATGSGKSTTLAAMINFINHTRDLHILTVEDPLEFVHTCKKSLIHHREVGTHTKSFQRALKSALREDPDVILVGEMRDLETISLALTAAETGHLVLGTLHTNNAISTIDRIIDVFPAFQQTQIRTQLAGTIECILSQILFARRDGNGRVASFEVLLGVPAVRNLIREAKIHQVLSIMQSNVGIGMLPMDTSLEALLKQHMILPQDAVKYHTNPDSLSNSMDLEREIRRAKRDEARRSYRGSDL